MDRRAFLAAGGLAALAPTLAAAADAAPPAAPLFSKVKFGSDGLGLNPQEYLAVLQEVAGGDGFEADYYSQGGALTALEARFAAALGKEAAIFLPTGTLANQLAVRTLAGADRRVLVQADSHLYADSGDGATTLAGLTLVPLGAGPEGLTVGDVENALATAAGGRVAVPVGAIAIESPIRRRDHAAVPFAGIEKIAALARAHGIRLHLDGSRLFSLPLHTGRPVKEVAALFDTVYVSTWKHFNTASGAMLAGPAALIAPLFHARRMYGGGLPGAWPLVAPAAKYLETFEADYAAAWARLDAIEAALRPSGRFAFRRIPDGTSRVYLRVDGVDPAAFVERARAHGVNLPPATEAGEFPLQVNATLLRRPADAIAAVLISAAG
jgi:threonine aldolase